MPIDEVPVQTERPRDPDTGSRDTVKFVVIFVILAALAVGEFVAVNRTTTLREQVTAQQNQLREDLTGQLRDQVANRLSTIERQNAQNLDAIQTELDQATKRVGLQNGELRKARTMVSQLEEQEKNESAQFQQELAQKADQEQVGALSQDVTSTKTDLNTTKTTVNTLASDLGMARSEMGTLIARNHDDIQYLRKMGDRDYFEFTLTRNRETKVAGVGLTLKRTNPKHHQFNLALLADDMTVNHNNIAIDSPVDFFVNGSRKPFELVVNSVSSNQVKGYLSTPKGVTEVAAATPRSEGTQH